MRFLDETTSFSMVDMGHNEMLPKFRGFACIRRSISHLVLRIVCRPKVETKTSLGNRKAQTVTVTIMVTNIIIYKS